MREEMHCVSRMRSLLSVPSNYVGNVMLRLIVYHWEFPALSVAFAVIVCGPDVEIVKDLVQLE
jgi:hypothetical protein